MDSGACLQDLRVFQATKRAQAFVKHVVNSVMYGPDYRGIRYCSKPRQVFPVSDCARKLLFQVYPTDTWSQISSQITSMISQGPVQRRLLLDVPKMLKLHWNYGLFQLGVLTSRSVCFVAFLCSTSVRAVRSRSCTRLK